MVNRHDRIRDIFIEAIEIAPERRQAFLDDACGPDAVLKAEVEHLIEADADGATLVAYPKPDEVTVPELFPGQELAGHFRVLRLIGVGGMGEVYRARDTKLDREVAIKILPDALGQDSERLARFQREAKVLASLNHPNIAQIYGIEDRALIMELVEGETVHGPIPLATALDYAQQIVEALEAAHEKGIVHRDLKPANIMITSAGLVKVLDFGLAAVAQSPASNEDPANSPTLTASLTRSGMILGTAAYMAPEQASGKSVDRRADIWSFGVVLWELLSGHRLFEAETLTQTLAEVLRGPIDFEQLPRETPAEIRRLLRRCLDRNPRNRLRDIGKARIAIEVALAGETLEGAPEPGGARHLWLAWSLAAVATVGVATVAFLHFRENLPGAATPLRVQIPPPENTTLGALLNLSPDGRKLAFVARGRLWVHSLESGESRDLTPGSGVPFWSPDSRYIGYPSQGKLKKIEATGGPSQTVTDYHSLWGGGAWNRDDMIVFSDRLVGLFRVPASGGVPVQITSVNPAQQETLHYAPSFLPDGHHFVYTRRSRDETKSVIVLGSMEARPEQQTSKALANSNTNPAYAPSADPGVGYLLFVREDTLMAQPFDNRRLELKGQAAPIAEHVGDGRAFSVSANDVLVFQRSAPFDRQLTWYDHAGKVLGTAGEPGRYQSMAISPDGTRLAVSKRSGQATNIWLVNLFPGGASTRFTFGSASDESPVWSPDGSRIIFSSNRNGLFDLYEKPANGGNDEVVLLKSQDDKRATSWSRDGRFLLYTVVHPRDKSDIWILPLDRDKKPVPFLMTEFNQDQAHFSPDDHWVAYTSDESGRMAVYVRSFAMNSAGTVSGASGKWQVSSGYGQEPRWRGDGRELYYLSVPDYDSMPDGTAMVVELATGSTFRAGKPEPLGILPPLFWWDSTADGRRFLGAVSQRGPQPYTVVLNWQGGLKK